MNECWYLVKFNCVSKSYFFSSWVQEPGSNLMTRYWTNNRSLAHRFESKDSVYELMTALNMQGEPACETYFQHLEQR